MELDNWIDSTLTVLIHFFRQSRNGLDHLHPREKKIKTDFLPDSFFHCCDPIKSKATPGKQIVTKKTFLHSLHSSLCQKFATAL